MGGEAIHQSEPTNWLFDPVDVSQALLKCFLFLRHNTVWVVENYSNANDPEYRKLRKDRLSSLQQQSLENGQ